MGCPYCEEEQVWYGANRLLHLFRIFLGSRKRYCPTCHRKWRVRTHKHYRPVTLREIFAVIFFIAAGFGVFYFVSGWVGSGYRPAVDKQRRMSTAQELMKQVQGRIRPGAMSVAGIGASQDALIQKARGMIGKGGFNPSQISAKDRERLMKKAQQYM